MNKKIKFLNGLPLFNAELGLSGGVDAISVVDDPAIDITAIKMKDEKLLFQVQPDQQLLISPIMLANKPILRKHPSIGYYYIQYKAETIKEMAYKYLAGDNHHNFNFNHSNEQINGSMVESWLISSEQDKAYGLGFNLEEVPVGSWMATIHFPDSKQWEMVKSEEFRGVSLEGNFGLSPEYFSNVETDASILAKIYSMFEAGMDDDAILEGLRNK